MSHARRRWIGATLRIRRGAAEERRKTRRRNEFTAEAPSRRGEGKSKPESAEGAEITEKQDSHRELVHIRHVPCEPQMDRRPTKNSTRRRNEFTAEAPSRRGKSKPESAEGAEITEKPGFHRELIH